MQIIHGKTRDRQHHECQNGHGQPQRTRAVLTLLKVFPVVRSLLRFCAEGNLFLLFFLLGSGLPCLRSGTGYLCPALAAELICLPKHSPALSANFHTPPGILLILQI